jgi:hypothetical protein
MTEAVHPQFPNQPDNFNRRAYTDMAIKIYGGYAPSKLDVRQDSRELKIILTSDDIEAMKEYKRMREEADEIDIESLEKNEDRY